MKEYLEVVEDILQNGTLKHNRTGVDTLSTFAQHYRIDLRKGFPLLTTKKMHWASIVHELLWYISGEDHIRNLREKTKIWDSWAREDGTGGIFPALLT